METIEKNEPLDAKQEIKKFLNKLGFHTVISMRTGREYVPEIDRNNPYLKTFLELGGKIKDRCASYDRYACTFIGWAIHFKYNDMYFTLEVNGVLRVDAITMRKTKEASPVDITHQDKALTAKLFKNFREKLEAEAKDEVRKYHALSCKWEDLKKEKELLELLYKKAQLRRAQRELRKSIES